MLAWFGTVDLVLDRRHQFTVSTGLATCLFMIEERIKLSNNDLAECMGGIDAALMRKLVQPLLDSSVVTEENGQYRIEAANQVETNKLQMSKSLTAGVYTDLVASATTVKI